MTPMDAPAVPLTSFTTYLEYIEIASKLGTSSGIYGISLKGHLDSVSHREWTDNLNLLRLYRNGKPSVLYLYQEIKSPEVFRAILATFDDDIEYQVLLLELDGNHRPPAWAVDMVGLGLDMEPEVWAHLTARYPNSNSNVPLESSTWIKRNDFIEVDNDALMIMDAVPNVRPRTAILFLDNFSYGHAPLASSLPPYLRMHPPDRPSSLRKQTPSQASDSGGQPYEGTKECAVRRWISNAATNPAEFGPNNLLFACLEALLRWQMCVMPAGWPLFRGYNGIERHVARGDTPDMLVEEVFEDPGIMWNLIRNKVDTQRITLLALPTFVMDHFNMQDKSFERTYKRLLNSYDQYVRELEVAESRWRDHISYHQSQKSTEMAELSIRESKRVILLTILAFVFVPVSLASSIYGMNIQQINSTGHDIRSFVVTAVALLLMPPAAWAGAVRIVAYRRRRIRMIRRRHDKRRSLIDKILLIREWNGNYKP